MEAHYLSLLYHGCYLPSGCMWVTHCSGGPYIRRGGRFRAPIPVAGRVLRSGSPSLVSVGGSVAGISFPSSLIPVPPFVSVAIALSRYRPSFVARLDAVSLGIYLATFVERMLPLARVQH